MVQFTQRFVLALDHINLLYNGGLLETLPVALHKEEEVTR